QEFAAGVPRAGRRTGISVCMIVKNEETRLAQCLRSVWPVAEEIIVVDTGSTDRTPEIAAAFGARVFAFRWTNDFSAARNFSLDQARLKWVLTMDADEVLAPQDYPALLAMTQEIAEPTVAWTMAIRNYVPTPDF